MKNAFIICFLFVILVACSEQNILPIEDKIILEMVELKDSTTNVVTLQFNIATEEEYPCYNYPIISSGKWSDGRIRIDIDGVQETNFCLTAFGPARTEIGFGGLQTGEYEVIFKIKRKKVKGTLSITEDEYQLDLESNEIVEVVNPVLVKEK
ncbi:MAG: hypothetical protein R3B93_11065 [Bacteroidia bacterium]